MNTVLFQVHAQKTDMPQRAIWLSQGACLANPFSVNERWDINYVNELYLKWLNRKLKDKDTQVISSLTQIASLMLDGSGKPVILVTSSEDQKHGEVIRELILNQIKRKTCPNT